MALPEIQYKLQLYLEPVKRFTGEDQVVYLLVEIRKLLEHEGVEIAKEYPYVKFCSDWALHTEKSRNFRGVEYIFEEIYKDCKDHVEQYPMVVQARSLTEFLYFSELRKQLRQLFSKYGLPVAVLEDDKGWVSFVTQLLGVLIDQPIKKIPNPHLQEIVVIGANQQSAAMRVYFAKPLVQRSGKEVHYYQLANAF